MKTTKKKIIISLLILVPLIILLYFGIHFARIYYGIFPEKNTPVSDEEYLVYSATLAGIHEVMGKTEHPIILSGRTGNLRYSYLLSGADSDDPLFIANLKEMRHLRWYISKEADLGLCDRLVTLPGCDLIDESKLKFPPGFEYCLGSDSKKYWFSEKDLEASESELRKNNPSYQGGCMFDTLVLSRVVFDGKRTTGLVLYGLYGGKGLYLLKKVKDAWKIERKVIIEREP